ncbi:MAG: BTAD domain-containing putative transcriptional regulator, partial [Acidimicrobiia bacterium]
MKRTLRLQVLGPFDASWSDGESAGLRNKKARALLAYLAVEHGRPHARERLAGMLWGETGDERARHNLRQSLSAIRQSCGNLIVSRDELLEIDQTCCRTDVIDFERLARSEKPDELLQCVEFYRGDLLEDLDPREPVYDEWLNLARARLRRIACQVIDDLANALAAEGRHQEAIQALERRLSMDPCCEAAHRQLMELFTRVGRRTDALRQYRSCVETLERELGAEPDTETKELHTSLQRARPTDTTGPPGPSAAPGEATRPKLAILPFDNLSADTDDYFVDGIVEDLTTALSCFHSLVVVARGSSFTYRGRDVPERQIADELGVQFLVRGSVRRAGPKVRVNIQLLDAFASSQLWGHRFDRDLEDL